MKTQKLFLLTIVIVLTFCACSPTPTVVPTTFSSNPTQGVVAMEPLQSTSTAMPTAAVIEASPTVEIVPTVTGNLSFQVTSPLDGDIVNIPQVDVIGSAPSGTVVSVNDDIIVVGENGQFKSIVVLDEGPNLIEIVASDDNGNETDLELTVVYEP
jgi:Glucodextranase, domain B